MYANKVAGSIAMVHIHAPTESNVKNGYGVSPSIYVVIYQRNIL